MREHDRRGHELGGFVARITEHQTLIAGALLRGLLALGLARVNTLRDVGRLLGDEDIHEHLVRMKHVVVVHIADFADRLPRDIDVVELGFGRDFATDDGQVGLHVRLAGDTAHLVLCEAGVEDCVGDRVCHLVWMAFADGLGRENVTVAHVLFCSFSFSAWMSY